MFTASEVLEKINIYIAELQLTRTPQNLENKYIYCRTTAYAYSSEFI